ncbi:hypothetical protein FNV43_RR02307 [Rhamnella rubrinervis]|uniref:F-box domain-containing protein n=1 Tax=Rhamnella rubrinervis TaxID=2594499 RepID=A0A8K0HTK4_9ROSA|nr:hypothetical protein FNV43_RR02307 [Rhamnella rubrinervis]
MDRSLNWLSEPIQPGRGSEWLIGSAGRNAFWGEYLNWPGSDVVKESRTAIVARSFLTWMWKVQDRKVHSAINAIHFPISNLPSLGRTKLETCPESRRLGFPILGGERRSQAYKYLTITHSKGRSAKNKMELTMLPEECISHIISFTSPRDACRSSLVCPLFRSAVDSDAVWGNFLPYDHGQILSKSGLASSMDSISKKDLFFHLCDHPVVIDNGTMSFAIDKKSGKKCYMIGARRLSIAWGDTPSYWRWRSLPAQSRFLEVAELRFVWWLDIKGRIETNMLSPKTRYAAYFVYKLKERSYGFQEKPVKLRVYFEGEEEHQEVLGHVNGYETSTTSVFLEPPQNMLQQFKERGDGWMEVEMGNSSMMVEKKTIKAYWCSVYSSLITLPLNQALLLKELSLGLKQLIDSNLV